MVVQGLPSVGASGYYLRMSDESDSCPCCGRPWPEVVIEPEPGSMDVERCDICGQRPRETAAVDRGGESPPGVAFIF